MCVCVCGNASPDENCRIVWVVHFILLNILVDTPVVLRHFPRSVCTIDAVVTTDTGIDWDTFAHTNLTNSHFGGFGEQNEKRQKKKKKETEDAEKSVASNK